MDYSAAQNGYTEVVKLLVDHNADAGPKPVKQRYLYSGLEGVEIERRRRYKLGNSTLYSCTRRVELMHDQLTTS